MPELRFSGSAPERKLIETWRTSAWLRRLLALVLGLSLITAFSLATPLAVQARPLYSCGNATSGTHCYAYADTNNSAFYNAKGATVKILVVQMQCSQCGGNPGTTSGFVNNEMWFYASGYYWVEVGYLTQADAFHSWEDYFWGDKRPVDCSTCVNYHDMGGIPSGDYNQYATFTIKRTSSNSFHATVSSPNASKSGDSTNNTMDVAGVQMGQELAGNAGASAPNARYIYRSYWNSSGVSTSIGGNYSVWDPSGPPYFNYISGSGSVDFYTHCC